MNNLISSSGFCQRTCSNWSLAVAHSLLTCLDPTGILISLVPPWPLLLPWLWVDTHQSACWPPISQGDISETCCTCESLLQVPTADLSYWVCLPSIASLGLPSLLSTWNSNSFYPTYYSQVLLGLAQAILDFIALTLLRTLPLSLLMIKYPLTRPILFLACYKSSLVAQTVKRLPKMQETQVQSLGWEDPLKNEMATHSSTLAWKIPWTEEPGRLQSMGSQRVRHDWETSLHFTYQANTCESGLMWKEGLPWWSIG